jgi:hypothetical protein
MIYDGKKEATPRGAGILPESREEGREDRGKAITGDDDPRGQNRASKKSRRRTKKEGQLRMVGVQWLIRRI